jgi:hypothetical protein
MLDDGLQETLSKYDSCTIPSSDSNTKISRDKETFNREGYKVEKLKCQITSSAGAFLKPKILWCDNSI